MPQRSRQARRATIAAMPEPTPNLGQTATSIAGANAAPPAPAALYPPLEPFASGWLAVGHGHRIYWEQCGNPDGLPVLMLHGGPGSGASPRQRQCLDPGRYRLVLFDQRGCGRSTPLGETRHNSTPHLLADIEALRRQLGIERWLVFGGSWGATLAAVYAAAHRRVVVGVVMRALFLTGRRDLDWFFEGGAAAQFPEAWAAFSAAVPAGRRQPRLRQLAAQLDDASRADATALAWRDWERVLCGQPPAEPPSAEEARLLRARYRIQAAYMARRCDLGDAAVSRALARLSGLPVAFLHGRRDWVCRIANVYRAQRALPTAQVRPVADGGHDPFTPGMLGALQLAVDAVAARGRR